MHFHHFGFLRNKELNELYASISLRSFAIALTGLFIPIYLYTLNYSFVSIFFFFFLSAFFNLVFLFPVAKFISKFGVKHAILSSMPFLIIFYLLLFSLENFNWPLYVLALFTGIHCALFWFAYHLDFSRFSNKKLRGVQIGFSKVIISIFGAIGPLVGSIILYFFGFKLLFASVSLLLLLSTFPLFLSKEVHEPIGFSLKDFFKGHKLRNVLAYMGTGAETRMGTVLWPLFLFIFILEEKYISLGVVSTIAFSLAILSTFLIAKFSDLNKRILLKMGIIFNSLVWFVKSFLYLPVHAFISGAFYGISYTMVHIPFEAINYDKINKSNRLKIILEREFYLKFGASVFLLIMTLFSESLIYAFRYGGPIINLMRFFF